jgi:hypothetical protein
VITFTICYSDFVFFTPLVGAFLSTEAVPLRFRSLTGDGGFAGDGVFAGVATFLAAFDFDFGGEDTLALAGVTLGAGFLGSTLGSDVFFLSLLVEGGRSAAFLASTLACLALALAGIILFICVSLVVVLRLKSD